MAELLLKVDDGSNYEDGDVLCAFNRRRIRWCHAQHLTTIRYDVFNGDGLRPVGSLAQKALELTKQYRFRRISRTEVRR